MVTKQKVSSTIEEYLEQIYRLEEVQGVARTTALAERVGVSLGTVTNTVETLKQKDLVIHEPYKGVKLTEAGRKIALDVLRRHRLSECLLTKFLNIDWSRVHEYACRLEHPIMGDLIKPLAKALGHPRTCPYGNPIPTNGGGILEGPSILLETLEEGEEGVLVKIVNERRELLEYLLTMNLIPGVHVEIVKKAPFKGPTTIRLNGQTHALSWEIASIIWVKEQD